MPRAEKRQKSLWEYLRDAGLNPYCWDLVRQTSQALVVRNRASGLLKTILK